ncbi:four helix bundle protein [Membranicola marinus]|uniref:Four helix bundle protein n=1 Tax=Membranihabitans marinus TaxID=1227546 RepID=A0A953L8V6_9BACT|nr:four helix bundle protein [Membranihabitans marinus]MBY5960222.1 four helix bundle protein [Membranihabitans marinus]
MFDFEKLEVNDKIEQTNKILLNFLFSSNQIDKFISDQLKRACISVALNLAEGVGRMTPADKKHFFIMARGSVNECVALLKLILNQNWISKEEYQKLYDNFELISKMLLGMIRSTGRKKVEKK